jgi:hypothetical protein
MNDSFYTFLIYFLIVPPILLFVLNFLKFVKAFINIKRSTSPHEDSIEIVNISEEIVGRYQDKDISRYITIADGRVFEYEGIAHKTSEGIYYTSEPGKVHVKIDNLLYKMVSYQHG